MKKLNVIIQEIREVSLRLNEAKQENPLISLEQKVKNIFYLETKLSTLLFCAGLVELDKHIKGFNLGINN